MGREEPPPLLPPEERPPPPPPRPPPPPLRCSRVCVLSISAARVSKMSERASSSRGERSWRLRLLDEECRASGLRRERSLESATGVAMEGASSAYSAKASSDLMMALDVYYWCAVALAQCRIRSMCMSSLPFAQRNGRWSGAQPVHRDSGDLDANMKVEINVMNTLSKRLLNTDTQTEEQTQREAKVQGIKRAATIVQRAGIVGDGGLIVLE